MAIEKIFAQEGIINEAKEERRTGLQVLCSYDSMEGNDYLPKGVIEATLCSYDSMEGND